MIGVTVGSTTCVDVVWEDAGEHDVEDVDCEIGAHTRINNQDDQTLEELQRQKFGLPGLQIVGRGEGPLEEQTTCARWDWRG